jgi:hypothetical protein
MQFDTAASGSGSEPGACWLAVTAPVTTPHVTCEPLPTACGKGSGRYGQEAPPEATDKSTSEVIDAPFIELTFTTIPGEWPPTGNAPASITCHSPEPSPSADVQLGQDQLYDNDGAA